MASTIEKMRIRAPHVLCILNSPEDFENVAGKQPEGISFHTDVKKSFNSLHWFIKTKKQVDIETPRIMKYLKPGMVVWCYYPKSSSSVQTDLTRDKGWDTLLAEPDIKWMSLISINETWSAFAFRLKTEKDKADEAKPKAEREIFKYADSKTKMITLPEDMAKVLAKNKKAGIFFDNLAFSNKREYVEWVVNAKREETRNKRIKDSIRFLAEGRKNPYNR